MHDASSSAAPSTRKPLGASCGRLLPSACHPRVRRGIPRTRLWPESARTPVSPRTVFRPYAALFAVPGSLAFSFVGWLARLPMPMVGLGAVLLVAGENGSYGPACGAERLHAAGGSGAPPP